VFQNLGRVVKICVILWSVEKKRHRTQISLAATPAIRGNPDSRNAPMVTSARYARSQDNVGKSASPARINCQDKNAMKSIMRTTVRVVNYD
jgi:hypothetical protein